MMPPSDDRRRADRGARVLVAPDLLTLQREFARVGCSEEGIEIMSPKGVARLVRLDGVPTKAANVIKQEMLARGGDAVVHWQTITCGVPRTDVVIIGTDKQYHALCRKLHRAPFGLPATADAILEALAHFDRREPSVLRCGRFDLPLGRKTLIMGILNVTPDSFSGDGDGDVDAILRRAEAMAEDGADLIDIGGESTRPGAEPVAEEEELRRVIPAVRALAPRVGLPISVDTTKSVVARDAIAVGATLVNDISGLRADPAMAGVIADAGLPVVVMHMRGTPQTMQQAPAYTDLMTEICAALQESTRLAVEAGIPWQQVVLDPGFGFGKTVAHNLELVRRLRELRSYGQPVLLGPSRKSTIGAVLGNLPVEERLEGTAATVALAIANGADIVRVHDVRAMARVARMTDAIARG